MSEEKKLINNGVRFDGRKLDELREELATAGVSFYIARVKQHLGQFFNKAFSEKQRKKAEKYQFQTLKPAIKAYLEQQQARGLTLPGTDAADPASHEPEWREPVQPVQMGKQNRVPENREDKDPALYNQTTE